MSIINYISESGRASLTESLELISSKKMRNAILKASREHPKNNEMNYALGYSQACSDIMECLNRRPGYDPYLLASGKLSKEIVKISLLTQ